VDPHGDGLNGDDVRRQISASYMEAIRFYAETSPEKCAILGLTDLAVAESFQSFESARSFSDAVEATLAANFALDQKATLIEAASCSAGGAGVDAVLRQCRRLTHRYKFNAFVLLLMAAIVSAVMRHPLAFYGTATAIVLAIGAFWAQPLRPRPRLGPYGSVNASSVAELADFWAAHGYAGHRRQVIRHLGALRIAEFRADRRTEALLAAVLDAARIRRERTATERAAVPVCSTRRHRRPERCLRPPGLDRPAASPRRATAPPSTSREVGYPARSCCA